VVAETHLEDGHDTEIEIDLERLTRYLLLTGNRPAILYLQQHSKDEYAEKIRGVLRPADTLADFTTRARAAEDEAEPYSHDEDIELIVTQEIERGLLADALQKAKLMRVRILQTRVMGTIALAAYNQGDLQTAESAVEAALEKARPYLSRMIDHVLAKH